ncbi:MULTISPECIES: ABC transporter ATP-binding protein [unclassified Corynebacterium]|uniref:ABC transporter ATP-binding protein n=1 Tax=unclassified Corynebacterium TaxID=2624378 RepID=UPI0029C9F476|nr:MULTISPECIES: ABC transporter ATP-binding protein [unclassified Corynebacterium]WPF66001.1 ABC transporter ATP-binding protein [Corynebacterium sp. 22KM0430]WPF68494.1 ABC transporter ATP-binding protein [Corynebacterium sp. 21KM1197]
MSHTIIDVQGLKRVYADSRKGSSYTAVADSAFRVQRGEIFGLLGTNGAGKTSTLEVIEGLARPSAGSVRIHGLDPYQERTQLRPHIGIMLQSGGLPPQLTVRETLAMWGGTLSHPLPVDEVAAAVELSHRMEVKVSALSGGEQRRLDLGCALAGNPSVVFLDEPTTGLDPESRSRTWQLLLELKKRGVTMILTTHYLEEAEYLCDRIAIMHRSKIVREGTVQDLVAQEDSLLRFHSPQPAPDIFTGSCIRDGAEHTVLTRDLPRDTHAALNWAQSQGIRLSNFSAQPASLETVFLSLTQSAPAI